MPHPTMPSISEVNAAAASLALVAAASNNPAGAQQEARQVCERARAQRGRFLSTPANGGNTTAIVFADATRADLAALFAAEAVDIVTGNAFSVADADDTTDNALQAAKGGAAVANKDVFQRTGAAAVKYLGENDASFATMDASLVS